MKFVLYLLILLGATLLGFDLANEVRKIETEPAPEPTKPVKPTKSAESPGGQAQTIEDLQNQLATLGAQIAQSPDNPEAYVKRAEIHGQMRQYKKAIEDLDKASALSPQDADIAFQRGFIHIATGQADKAFTDFSRTLEIDPTHAKARIFRSIINYREGKFQAALDDSLELIRQDATFLDAHITASRCYFELNDKAKAIEHLNTYISQSKDPAGIQEARRLLNLWNQGPAENPASPSTPDE